MSSMNYAGRAAEGYFTDKPPGAPGGTETETQAPRLRKKAGGEAMNTLSGRARRNEKINTELNIAMPETATQPQPTPGHRAAE